MSGIECYVSDHKGFFGKIKENYQDFEVREIDLQGNVAQPIGAKDDRVKVNWDEEVVDCISGDFAPKPAACADSCHRSCDGLLYEVSVPNPVPVISNDAFSHNIHQSAKHQNLEISDIGDEDNKMELLKCGDKQPIELLKDLLDSSVLAQLDDSKFNSASQFSSSNLIHLDISIGIFDNKGTRTVLHQCIRYAYPYLKTIVSKTDDGHSEIKVLFDNAYGDFFHTGISKEDIDDLFRFIHCQFIVEDKSTFVLKVGENKKQRTLIHRLIRQYYGSFLESKSFMSGDMAITSEVNVRFRNKRNLPGNTNNFSPIYRFVLCKRNIELSDAIAKLSHALKTKPSAFSFAGTKDKKAITYQYVTTNEIGYEELEKFANLSQRRDVEILRTERVRKMLRLGDLKGNMFRIILRKAELENGENLNEVLARVRTAISNVTVNGFINYFGEQRFGFEDNPVSSADIGLAMLQGDFVKAVDLILTPTGQGGEVDDAKRYFQETKDAASASNRMPVWKSREACILRGLKQHGYSQYGCCQTLLSLPYNVRLMYVHSYCSLLWNKMASKRVKLYGLRPTEGDIILLNGDPETPVAIGEEAILRHHISDIALPLPGFKVVYPSNLVNDYEEALRKDGLERKNFRLRKIRLNVPGVYRKLLSYPKSMCWSLVNSDDTGIKHPGNDASRPTKDEIISNQDKNSQMLQCDEGPWDNIDVKIEFSLVPSSYATICLREIMHS